MAEQMISNANSRLEMSSTQPNSRLHALPQELQEMIFAFAVVSLNPIPARVHLKDIETTADNDDDDDDTNPSDGSSPTIFTTLVKIDPSQPALSRIDGQTRPAALRIFYTQNTFLFRAHAYVEGPLRKWLDATEHTYAPQARTIRRVLLEMGVAKTCDGAPQPLVTSRRGRPDQQRHLYRVLVAQQPGDEGVRVRFGADLAVMCSCAMRTAGLLKPAPHAQRFSFLEEREISLALRFAQDVEYDIVLTNECKYHFCDEEASSTCRDCGLRVHRNEPLGEHLLERVRWEVQAEEERREREAAREAEREAARGGEAGEGEVEGAD